MTLIRQISVLVFIGLFCFEFVKSTCGVHKIVSVNCSNSTIVVTINFNITDDDITTTTTLDQLRRKRSGTYGSISNRIQSNTVPRKS